MIRPVACLAVTAFVPYAARAATPLNYLHASGEKARIVLPLTYAVLAISLIVIVVTGLLLLWAIFHRRLPPDTDPTRQLRRSAGGLRWIYIGTGVSTVVLFGVAVWTYVVLAAIATPAHKAAFTVEITAHQWWWQARYLSDDPARIFTTANEIHIPVGAPVRFTLHGVDVIHSFWVPALTGKTEVIPGQVNTTWLEADKAGTYLGQCTLFCGAQHAKMGLSVVADPPASFAKWWNAQVASAKAAPGEPADVTQGRAVFIAQCGVCHAVRGTNALGIVGPDLTHLMSRHTIAAGTLPNTVGNLAGWIADPQAIKPDCLMPDPDLSGPELQQVVAFLRTLS